MEKASVEMDLDEWEFIPDNGFLEFHHHKDGWKRFSPRKASFDPKSMFDMNYFICPSPNSHQIVETPTNSSVSKGMKKLVPVPILLEPTLGKTPDYELVKEVTKDPIEISIIPPVVSEKIKTTNMEAVGADQDPVSQVFFKKMKENEFVDMKMDSPKSSSRGSRPQIEMGSIQFEEKEEAYKGEAMEHKTSSKETIDQEMVKKDCLDSNIKEETNWEGSGLNIWRWRLTGIGALCSIGVAAATICIFIFGSRQRHKHQQQNQKLRFQIYDDKTIKQVVHHATKLNQALSAVRGVPHTRAHITSGGYYQGL
ncbi:hypothetical protein HHK36_017503 [Tetracentron sinense]|uniref:DUF6821 domain-containing protein n=1 Tax=Tetracentron sinense TaxID=13715 RepID=A0A834Z8E9_TETSI|nr:hypothetical protein HHK36_017503 [Tetracentron sinense]